MHIFTRLCVWHIKRTSVEEVDRIMTETFRRRVQLFPDYDPIYLALPKYDLEERERQLAYFNQCVRNMHYSE